MNIVFYDDAADYGGHEAMTLEAVSYLAGQPNLNIIFLYYKDNKRLYAHLEKLQNNGASITLVPVIWHSRIAQGVLTLLMPLAVFRLKRLLQSFAPNLVIVIQGGIEVSSLALLAARRAKLKVVSYIPLAHKLSDTSFKLGWIRDFVNKYFFQIPDAFITVSPSMKRMLVETRNVKVPIIVVWNGINLSKLVFHDKHKWRQQYNIAPHEYVVAIMGRIYFKQKGHDFLVNSIRIHQAKMKNIRFLIIGDGPDSIELRRLIQEYELNHVITVLPWNNDLSYIYSGVDAVTIPSRYEGLPLVMLEAMYYKLPIIASDIDVMSDLLPEIWLFKLGDSDSFVETLLHVKNNNWSTQLLINHESIINNFNSEMFVKSFQQAVCDVWLDKVE